MSKKIFVIFLSLFLMLFAVSGAVADEIEKTATDYNGTFTITYNFDYESDDITALNDDDSFYVGRNVYAQFTFPTLALEVGTEYSGTSSVFSEATIDDIALSQDKITFAWSIDGLDDYPNLRVTSDDTKITVMGVAPESADDYDITLKLVATISAIDTTGKTAIEGTDYTTANTNVLTLISNNVSGVTYSGDLTINVTSPDSTTLVSSGTSFDTYVKAASGVDKSKATKDYSVTVAIPVTQKDEGNGIENSYTHIIVSEDAPVVDLPKWLYVKDTKSVKIDTTEGGKVTSDGDDSVISLDLALSPDVKVANGTPGKVFINLTNVDDDTPFTLVWDVTYQAAEEEKADRPFGISGDKEVSIAAGSAPATTITLTISGDSTGNITWTHELENTASGIAITDGATVNTPTTKNAAFNISVPATTKSGDYPVKFTATDEDQVSADFTVTIKVTAAGSGTDTTAFTLTPSVSTLSIDQGASKDVTVTSTLTVTKWEASADSALTVVNTASADKSATFAITASSNAASGDHIVTITATDENSKTQSTDITVTVTEASTEEEAFEITASSSTLSVAVGGTGTVTLTANQTISHDLWEVNAENADFDDLLEFDITASADMSADIILSVDSTAVAGTYIVNFVAYNEIGDSADVDVTLTVTDEETTTYGVTLSKTSEAVSMARGGTAVVEVSISSTPSGDVTWASSNVPAGLSVDIRGLNTGARIGIAAATTATAGTKSPFTVTATDAAGNSAAISITVTITSGGDSSSTTDDSSRTATVTEISDSVKQTLLSKFASEGLKILSSANSLAAKSFSALVSVMSSYFASNSEVPMFTIPGPEVVSQDGNYAWGSIALTDFTSNGITAGQQIFLVMVVSSDSTVTNGSVKTSTVGDTSKGMFVNNSGDVITTLPSSDDGIIPKAYLSANTQYSPMITVASADSSNYKIGPSGAGCSSISSEGFGIRSYLILLLFALGIGIKQLGFKK